MPSPQALIAGVVVLIGGIALWRRHASLGIATKVVDGDSFTLIRGRGLPNVRIRVAWMDAPEHDQRYGHESATMLRDLISRKEVKVRMVDTDKYGRRVARVVVRETGVDAGFALLQAGLAWNLPGRSPGQSWLSRSRYAWAQSQARAKRLGLWADPNPVAPWVHRHPPLWKRLFS